MQYYLNIEISSFCAYKKKNYERKDEQYIYEAY